MAHYTQGISTDLKKCIALTEGEIAEGGSQETGHAIGFDVPAMVVKLLEFRIAISHSPRNFRGVEVKAMWYNVIL